MHVEWERERERERDRDLRYKIYMRDWVEGEWGGLWRTICIDEYDTRATERKIFSPIHTHTHTHTQRES